MLGKACLHTNKVTFQACTSHPLPVVASGNVDSSRGNDKV